MPTFNVQMFEGRTPEQKKKLVEGVTRATVEALGCSPEAVDIIITEVRKQDWATGGKLWSEPRD
jgi:4-oxalocrotonate tautomerase